MVRLFITKNHFLSVITIILLAKSYYKFERVINIENID